MSKMKSQKVEVVFSNGVKADAYEIAQHWFAVNTNVHQKKRPFDGWSVKPGRHWALYNTATMLITATLDTKKACIELAEQLNSIAEMDWSGARVMDAMKETPGVWQQSRSMAATAEKEAIARYERKSK